ncbi:MULTISPECIES: S41 family peptidase [unclassified Myroides]|uniref:S41 family peptidase n=1 Tax=unclassified Myroides TaxID=2642485 RepID=UPI0015FBD389|nr:MULTISPECIES: S41 family peptidase [unclassified Myroides]MBB1150445.1 peptidase S41 [Myroides sp. NP-2]MDM1407408.1 peptidase S41 [Myroides sp. DF42-4-2]
MRNVVWAIFFSLFCNFSVFSQVKGNYYTAKEYIEDFDFMVDLVKHQHPNPFRFITEKDFDKEVSKRRKRLEKEPTLERFILDNPLYLIRDAHLELISDPLLFEKYSKQANFFPLSTLVYDNRVWVNQYSFAIPSGAELLRVNGQDVGDLLRQMPDKVDGHVQASTQKDFSLYISLFFPKATVYTVEYRANPKEDVKTIQINSVNYMTYDYNNNKSILPLALMAYKTGIYGMAIDDSTYILYIKSFNPSEEYAYTILNAVFAEIKEKNIQHLIIDIRDNAGGSLSNIPLFYSFISKSKTFKNSYKYATKVPEIRVKDNLVDENDKLATGSEIAALNNFMKQRFDLAEDGFYYGNNRLEEYYIENYPQDKNAFTGTVVLLQNNNTVSAAAYFAYVFELNQRGLKVGQETRSCGNFTTAAWFLNYKLPHSGFLVTIPRSEIFFNVLANKENSCRGVIPDYTITAEAFQEGLQKGEDAELQLALSVLKKGN